VKRTRFAPLSGAFLLAASTAAVSAIEIVGEGVQALHTLDVKVFIGPLQDDDHAEFPFGVARDAEALVESTGVFNEKVLSSALAQPSGNIEVGVKNLGALRNSFSARATNEIILLNPDQDLEGFVFRFEIPGGEIQLLDPRGLAPGLQGTPHAAVSVKITTMLNGGPIKEVFTFGLEVKIENGEVKAVPSGRTPPTFREVLLNPGLPPSLHGFVLDRYKGGLLFPFIPKGSSFFITYEMTASGGASVFETGFLARLGDPLDLAAASPPLQIIVDPAVHAEGVTADTLVVDAAARALSDGNGVFEPGETVSVEPGWRNNGGARIALTGVGSQPDGPAGPTYETGDAAAAYGTIPPDEAANCSETADCYSVSISDPATRPGTHWDATLPETVDADNLMKDWTLHVGESFSDVPRSHPFYKRIETIFHHGVTVGCSSADYCPAQKVPRSQMAIFIARALARGGALPETGLVEGAPYDCVAGGTSLFDDVSPDSIFCKGVHFIAAQSVTAGCAPALFCPGPSVTRAEMAIFMAKGMVAPGGGESVPQSYGPDPVTRRSYSCEAASPVLHFGDISTADPFCKHAHFLWARGVIDGCSATEYCPLSEVGRDEMAKFLANAFQLELYGP